MWLEPHSPLTPSTPGDVLAAIRAAGAPETAVRLIAAQAAYETAGFVHGLWGWNIGNITQPNRQAAVYLPGNTLPFAHYPDLNAGAKAMVDLLTAHGVVAKAPDLSAYVDALKAMGYAGDADYSAYKLGMANWLLKLPT